MGLEILIKNKIKMIMNNDTTIGATEVALSEKIRMNNPQFSGKQEVDCLEITLFLNRIGKFIKIKFMW